MAEAYKGYSFGVEDNVGPVAIVTPSEQTTVIGALVKMDGRASFDRDGNPGGDLSYTWSFNRVPIGSQVALEGFQYLEPDDSVVSFAPDIIGFYEISLVVSDGSLSSVQSLGSVDVRLIIAPNNQGLIPDAKFIWNYLSDFWKLVEGRERFDVLWSASIQIIASELLKLYQYDYNKSIRDIQEVIQHRWMHYSSGLELDETALTGILADDEAGVEAATLKIDPDTALVLSDQPDFFNLVTAPLTEVNFVTTSYNHPVSVGRVLEVNGRTFTLARSSQKKQAVNQGDDDGETTIGGSTFGGSSFEGTQVGMNLLILTGADQGTYEITGVSVDGDDAQIQNTDGSAVSFSASALGLAYSVVPTTDNISCFFADQKIVPTRTAGQPWRFLPTLVTSELDFEQKGVSPGDLLEVEVTREDLNLTATILLHVVGVDRNRLGFVFNRDDLVDGTVVGGLSEEDQEALADSLSVTGISRDYNNVIQYDLEAEVVRNILNSVSFKRTYYETELTTTSSIDLGAFSVKLRPLKVIRNSRIEVDADTTSIPVLQEYIRQPDLAENDGQLYLVGRDGELHALDHSPYVLVENLDYLLDDESTIRGVANFEQNVDEIEIPRGDLIDRSVLPGDVLTVQVGSTFQVYDIRKVLTTEKVRVYPIPSSTETSAPFTLSRRVDGKYVRFTSGTFSKDSPAPERLWAELTYRSNSENIEKNFGVLVGVRREELEDLQVEAPYRSVVAGLMYALTRGPTVRNLRLSSQILLGLPFAENAGVITEINPAFRIREDGSPRYGRILIEGRDSDGNPLGITNIYLYPQGRQLEDADNPGEWIPATPNEAGIATNPATGDLYKVGDTVEQFAILSKGVEVRDYVDDPESVSRAVEEGNISALLTQYHEFSLRVNSDVTTPSDVSLTTSFIGEAKPHYIKMSAGLLKIIEDVIEIEDSLSFGRPVDFFDTESYGLPVAVKFDRGSGDDDYLSIDGVMHTRYVFGTDLATTYGSGTVESASGGFNTPGVGQSFDVPFIRNGDLLVIEEGSNKGEYTIDSVTSDTQLLLSPVPDFETLSDQRFRVYRKLLNPLFSGAVDVELGNDEVGIGQGTFSAGVAIGDQFAFYGGSLSSRLYEIVDIDFETHHLTVLPSVEETTGSYTGVVWRDGILKKYLIDEATDTPFTVGASAGSPEVDFSATSDCRERFSFLQPGDELVVPSLGKSFIIRDRNPSALKAYVSPPPAATITSEPAVVRRPLRQETSVSFDTLDRIPYESLLLELQLPSGDQDLLTTATSPTVSTVSGEDFDTLGVVPGDFLVIFEGGDSNRDIGYGDGVFPILTLPSTTQLTLTRNLTVTNGSPGVRYGIRRRKIL